MRSSAADLQFISGPSSWYHFQFEDDNGAQKTIHLFSDIHDFSKLCPASFHCKTNGSNRSKCFEFDYFLELFFKKAIQNKQYVDFFLESPYRLHQKELKINPDHNYLDLINHRFENCLTTTKKGCKYLPYIRMHYTDIRIPDYKYVTIGSFVMELYIVLLQIILSYSRNHISKEEYLEAVDIFESSLMSIIKNASDVSLVMMLENNFQSKVLKMFEPILKKKVKGDPARMIQNKLESLVDNLFDLVKIRGNKRTFIVKHQIDQLRKDNIQYKDKNMADWILSFFVEFSKVLSQRAKELNELFWIDQGYLRELENLTPNNAKRFYDKIWSQRETVLSNNILFDLTYLDAYILARMFRRFSKQKTTDISIVYAGNMHIETQRDFFTIFLNLNPIHVETNEDEQRCLSNADFNEIFDLN
jgi:hypothetical protein